MTILLLVALGLAIGLVLGALGGGGAVLAVPALVFLVGQTANEATTSSLVIVGAAAVTGVATHVRSGGIAWRTGLAFALAGVPAAWAGSRLNGVVDERVLLLGFGVLMLVAAAGMLRGQRARKPSGPEPAPATPERASGTAAEARTGSDTAVLQRPRAAARRSTPRAPWAAVLGAGLAVGLLTGFFGVGGGFVVVPALVLALRVPMSRAVGTSLVVVAITSATALLARIPAAEFEWAVIGPFAGAAVAATLVGRRIADRLPARGLQVGFAVLLVLVATYTLVRGLIG